MASSDRGSPWGQSRARRNPIERIGAVILSTTETLGYDAILLFRSVLWFRSLFCKAREIGRQMHVCGVMSFPVVVLV